MKKQAIELKGFKSPSASEIKKMAEISRAVKHPFRVKLLNLMHQHKQITVTELRTILNEVQPVVSQHLAILRRVKAVHTNRKGKEIYYFVNYKFFIKYLNVYIEFHKD